MISRAIFLRALTLVGAYALFGLILGLGAAHAADVVGNVVVIDLDSLKALIPAAWLPYLAGAMAVASLITAHVPPPASGSPLASVWAVLNFLAQNVRFAANAPAGDSPKPPGERQAGFARVGIIAALAGLGGLLWLAGCTSSGSVDQAKVEVDAKVAFGVACTSLPGLDAAFKLATVASGGVPAQVLADEALAVQEAQKLCANPPTSYAGALISLTGILADITAKIPAKTPGA